MNFFLALYKNTTLRLALLVISYWPTFALAADGDAPPTSIRTQEELLLFPLAAILLTVFLIFWTRRKR